MSTRRRCSPRRKIKPAACPTLSASSGVIVPLARPRMPSVPKYFRTIVPQPGEGRACRQMIGQLPETFKKNERFLRLWLKPLWAENTAALDGGGVLFSYFRLLSLSRRVGAGCVTLTGSEAGKLSSRPCSSECSSLRLRASSRSRLRLSSRVSSTTVCFGMATDVLLAGDGSRRVIVQITHGACLAFPWQGSAIGKISGLSSPCED